jgi:hypothetical protein
MAEVFAVHASKDEVKLLSLVRDVAEWSYITSEMLHRQNATCWEKTNYLFLAANCKDSPIRLGTKHIKNLSVPEEEHTGCLKEILENEIFVVIADFLDVGKDKIIQDALPLLVVVMLLDEIIHFLLSDVCVENFLVNSVAKGGWATSLCKLD